MKKLSSWYAFMRFQESWYSYMGFLDEAKEEIKKVGVVRVLTNLTEKVGSPNINGYAGGMMNYLTFTKDIRFSSSRLLSINSPWSLVDNVNQQFDLHASYDELD